MVTLADIIQNQYLHLSDLLAFLRYRGIHTFTIDDESEAEDDYTVEQMAEEDNKIWFLQNVYLFNIKKEWISRTLDKVRSRILLVRNKILSDGTRYCDTGEFGDLCKSLFAPVLKTLNETKEKLKEVRWCRPDMDEDDYPMTLSLMKDTEREAKVNLRESKRLVKKLLSDCQQFLFFLKSHSFSCKETLV